MFDYAMPEVLPGVMHAATKGGDDKKKKPNPAKGDPKKEGPVKTQMVPEKPADGGYEPPIEDIPND